MEHPKDAPLLALRLAQEMHKQGMTMYALAQKSGLAYRVVHKLLSGDGQRQSVWTLRAVARVLRVPIDTLVGTWDE